MLNKVSLRNTVFHFFEKFRVVNDEINVISFIFHLWCQLRFKDNILDNDIVCECIFNNNNNCYHLIDQILVNSIFWGQIGAKTNDLDRID